MEQMREQTRGSRTTEGVEEKETGRIEAFSDGVFAIAITLLILGITVPLNWKSDHLTKEVMKQWPSFVAYALSFVTILIMWVNHHELFKLIRRADHAFMLLNGLLLMLITFVNYPTALLANTFKDGLPPGIAGSGDQRFAALIFSGTFFVTALLYNALWRYAKHGGRLLARNHDAELVDLITRQYRLGPAYYLIAFMLAFFSVEASIAVNMLLAVYFSFTGTRRGG